MPIYSHSRLECFETCPLQFKFIYIDNIKRQEEGIEAFMGSRFHEVMEKLYKDLKCKTYSLKELLDYYESRWNKEYSDTIIVTKKDRVAEDYKNIGKKCIEDYYKRYYPFTQGRVLGLEKEIFINLKDNGKYRIRGFIDRLVQADDDTYEIHDYKTAGYLPAQKDFDEDRQLALYQIGIRQMWNDVKNIKLIWHYVAFDKEMVSTRTEKQLEELTQDTTSLIDKIESTKEFLPKESNLCEWCVYPDLCPKRKHLYKVEELPVNEYLKDNGVKLVNKYAELSSQKSEYKNKIDVIDTNLDKIKEAVIQYAEKEGIEVIRGSNNKLKISKKQKVSCPPKGSAERESLIKILHEINKWDEVSDIDIYAIERIINEGEWNANMVDKIKIYLNIETRKNLSLSKLKDNESKI